VLTLFLSLIDRLIKLVELRQTDKKQLFNDVVEPLFTQLQPVVDDYFSLFRRARLSAEKSRNNDDLQQAVEEIRTQRENLVHARLAVVQFAETLQSQVHDKRVAQFAHKVERFFLALR
jgi:hypothetical protein